MSRFQFAQYKTMRVTLRPSGWRKFPIVRMLPFQTGDRPTFNLYVKQSLPRLNGILGLRLIIRAKDDNKYIDQPPPVIIENKTGSSVNITMDCRFPYSGEYAASILFLERNNDRWHSLHSDTAATIQTVTNLKFVQVSIILITMTLSVGGTALGFLLI